MAKTFKDFYEKYWAWRSEEYDYHKKGVIPDRIKAALDFIQSDSKARKHIKILDVGCGEGLLGEKVKKRLNKKIKIYGVDISQIALENAKTYYDDVYQIDVDNEPLSHSLKDQNFDYVVSLEVMEHIIYPERLLEEIYMCLKNDGKLITSIPNFAFFKNRITVLRGNFPYEQHIFHPAEHIHYFTFYSFKKLLNEKGFNVLSIDGSSFALFFPLSHLPLNIQKRILYKFPNLFGKQIVFCCGKKLKE